MQYAYVRSSIINIYIRTMHVMTNILCLSFSETYGSLVCLLVGVFGFWSISWRCAMNRRETSAETDCFFVLFYCCATESFQYHCAHLRTFIYIIIIYYLLKIVVKQQQQRKTKKKNNVGTLYKAKKKKPHTYMEY
jgi:hypothetical protein